MTTPSMVSALRSRLARSASSATRNASPALIDGRVRLDQPVAHADLAAGAAGDLAVVGDEHDGDAALGVRAARAAPSPRRRCAVSRLPVGSSASSSVGSPTSARAIATRCCSPPDSWPGRCSSRCPRPTALERGRGPLAALARAAPRGRPAAAPTLSSALVRPSSWKDWKTKPMVRLRSSASSASDSVGDVAAADPQRARRSAGRGSRAGASASTCRSRTGRRSATYSPGSIAQADPAQGLDRDPVELVAAPYVDGLDGRDDVGHGTCCPSRTWSAPRTTTRSPDLQPLERPAPATSPCAPSRTVALAARRRSSTTHTASRRPSRNTAAAGTATASRGGAHLQVDDRAHARAAASGAGRAVGRRARGRGTAARRRSPRRGWSVVGVGSMLVTSACVRRAGHRVELGLGRDAGLHQQHVGLVDLRGQRQRRGVGDGEDRLAGGRPGGPRRARRRPTAPEPEPPSRSPACPCRLSGSWSSSADGSPAPAVRPAAATARRCRRPARGPSARPRCAGRRRRPRGSAPAGPTTARPPRRTGCRARPRAGGPPGRRWPGRRRTATARPAARTAPGSGPGRAGCAARRAGPGRRPAGRRRRPAGRAARSTGTVPDVPALAARASARCACRSRRRVSGDSTRSSTWPARTCWPSRTRSRATAPSAGDADGGGRPRGHGRRGLDDLDHRRAADLGDLDVRVAAPGAARQDERQARAAGRERGTPGGDHRGHRRYVGDARRRERPGGRGLWTTTVGRDVSSDGRLPGMELSATAAVQGGVFSREQARRRRLVGVPDRAPGPVRRVGRAVRRPGAAQLPAP